LKVHQAKTAPPPDPAKIHRGTVDRQRRLETTLKLRTVRIDEDILEQFQQLAAAGQNSEQLINQALREWLSAQSMKELVRVEIQAAVQQSLASFQSSSPTP
jgi:uncharacterized protein (DUF4415 family)